LLPAACLLLACCLLAASYVVVAADVMHDPFGFASVPAAAATAVCKI